MKQSYKKINSNKCTFKDHLIAFEQNYLLSANDLLVLNYY